MPEPNISATCIAYAEATPPRIEYQNINTKIKIITVR